jgi:acyl-CoA hydrolase
VGELLTLRASVNAVGTTSLDVGVRVEAEDPVTGERLHVATAYLVYVALDADGHPKPVPPLLCETDEERRRQREAMLRREARHAHQEALRAERTAERARAQTRG